MRYKSLIINTILFLTVILLPGCISFPNRPTPVGSILTVCGGPLTATSNIKSSKVSSVSSKGVLNLIAWGDSSIESAMETSGIKKIHHIDYDHFRLIIPLGVVTIPVYEKFTTIVYGE